jgi:hypothetical protein
VIIVRPDKPGDQGHGLYVFPFWGLTIDDVDYDGISLEVLADGRDIKENLFKLMFQENTNMAVLTKPLMEAPFRLDQTEYELIIADRELRKAHAKARTAYAKKSVEEQTLTYDVVLPANFKLSQRVFPRGVHGTEGELVKARCDPFAYFKPIGLNDTAGNPIMGLHPRLTWRFVDMNSAKEMGAVAADPGQALFAAAFRGL